MFYYLNMHKSISDVTIRGTESNKTKTSNSWGLQYLLGLQSFSNQPDLSVGKIEFVAPNWKIDVKRKMEPSAAGRLVESFTE
jgi:hypothetical protein